MPFGFEMSGDEREFVITADLNIDFRKAAQHVHAAAIEEEGFVGVRAAGGDWVTAQRGDVQGGIAAANIFNVGILETKSAERFSEFGKGFRASHFLNGEDVDVHRFDRLVNFGFGGIAFGLHRAVGGIEIKFEVIRSDCELSGVDRSRQN